jgi:hypothetical protein
MFSFSTEYLSGTRSEKLAAQVRPGLPRYCTVLGVNRCVKDGVLGVATGVS